MNDLVRRGYDLIAESYANQRDQFSSMAYLERFLGLLEPGATVLDLGCGSGQPVARHLLDKGFDVLGLDISPKQIALARQSLPAGRFAVADMQELRPEQLSVAGIVSLYAIIHIERSRHESLLRTLWTYLPEGGPLLVTMGSSDWEGVEDDFHGTSMFWSHYGPERNREMVEGAGFTVVLDEIDGSGGERHQVVLARAKVCPAFPTS